MLTSTKLRKPRYYKVYFLRLRIGVYLHAKFKVSSIIPTSFRQDGGGIGGGGGILPHPSQNEPLKSQPRLGLRLRIFGN